MLGLLLNLFFAWWLWDQAKDHFEADRNFIGWTAVVISAANFAAAMAMIL
jgi:hypothetical protein